MPFINRDVLVADSLLLNIYPLLLCSMAIVGRREHWRYEFGLHCIWKSLICRDF